MAQDFEVYKDNCLKDIWGKIREVETDIQYSSLFAENKKRSQGKLYSILFCLILAIPAIKNFIVSLDLLDKQSMASWIIDAAYIVIPIIITLSYPELMRQYLGLYEKDISDLLDLNQRLEVFKSKLLRIYAKAESHNNRCQLDKIMDQYNSVCFEHGTDITAHDKLTGEIDPDIEEKAQEKAKIYLEQLKTL